MGQTDTFVTPAGLLTVSTNTNYVGSARLRAGYAFDRTLLYITGGVGWINNELSAIAVVPPVAVGANQSQFHVGGVIGAGIEHAFAPNWTGKLEYVYSNYSSETYFNAISASADTHTLRVGLNYQIR
jgi:outer membrane immunogenic protein